MDTLVILNKENRSGYGNDSEGDLRLQDVDYFKLHPPLTITYLFFMTVSTFVGIVGNTMVSKVIKLCSLVPDYTYL